LQRAPQSQSRTTPLYGIYKPFSPSRLINLTSFRNFTDKPAFKFRRQKFQMKNRPQNPFFAISRAHPFDLLHHNNQDQGTDSLPSFHFRSLVANSIPMAKPRSQRSTIFRLFDQAIQPVYVLNEDRRITYVNQACSEWLKITVQDLIGSRIDFHTSPLAESKDRTLGGLSPPPLDSHNSTATILSTVYFVDNASLDRRQASFTRIVDEQGNLQGLLAIVEARPTTPSSETGDLTLPSREHSNAEAAVASDSQATPTSHHRWSPWALHDQLIRMRADSPISLSSDWFLGESPLARRLRARIQVASSADVNLLITSPPGGGAIMLARLIHQRRTREGNAPLIPIDSQLLDAEQLQKTITRLAREQRQSALDDAVRLLIADVDQLDKNAQHELAGLANLRGLKLRVISTSQLSLDQLRDGNRLIPELWTLISTLVVDIPALADRREDIPLLSQAFLEQHNISRPTPIRGFDEESLDQLLLYPWKNNIEELAEVIRDAAVHAQTDLIRTEDLPKKVGLTIKAAKHPKKPLEQVQLDQLLQEIEQELIDRAIRQTKGNKSKAAEILGITRARLHRRLEPSSDPATLPEFTPLDAEPNFAETDGEQPIFQEEKDP
jgi:transcriptional regulator with PAS, ATPase and Fis domain